MSTPTPSSSCDAKIVIGRDFEFFLRNRLKVSNFIWGSLDDGDELSFLVDNRPKDGTGCPGWWMFGQMMSHFGDRVTAIHGDWSYGNNLASVNQLTGSGVSLQAAAARTPTGRYAAAHGFRRIAVVTSRGTTGAYTSVHVRFER